MGWIDRRVVVRVLHRHIHNRCDEEPWLREYVRQVIADMELTLFKVQEEGSA